MTAKSCSTSSRSRLEVGSSRISTWAVDDHGAADGDQLLDGDRVAGEERARVDVEAEAVEVRRGACAWVALQSMPEPAAGLAAEHEFSPTVRFGQRLTSWYTVLMPAACASAVPCELRVLARRR